MNKVGVGIMEFFVLLYIGFINIMELLSGQPVAIEIVSCLHWSCSSGTQWWHCTLWLSYSYYCVAAEKLYSVQ